MRKHLTLFFLITISFAINSCKKHESINHGPIVPYDAGTAITTAIAGKVTAQDGSGLNGVEITIGTNTTITDIGGNFIIPQASINQKVGLIKATKAGYFAGSRTIIAQEKVINNIVIQLVKKTETGSFVNATGGTITVATGGSIVFPVNAASTKTGTIYIGTVKVSTYFLDPTSANCSKEMPGDLRGINTSNNEQILTSYGMMAVELQGSNGEVLQITTGKTATLSLPIASSIQANAPATIPLWFFDETKGMWLEQGTATKTGNNYIGNVSHFTWWNCDYGGAFVNYKVQLLTARNNPVANAAITLTKKTNTTNINWANTSIGYTASDGSVSGAIPYNEQLELKVYARDCIGTIPLYTKTIGPFTQDTDGGVIYLNTATNASIVSIKGTAVNCNGKLITNGYATITIGTNKYYEGIANGSINKSIVSCGSILIGTANVEIFDIDALRKTTTPVTINITGAGDYNISQVNVCSAQFAAHYKENYISAAGLPFSLILVVISDSSKVNYPTSSSIDAIIPFNKILTKKVYVLKTCNTYVLVDSSKIGPFTSDFNAGVMNVNYTEQNTITISGNVIDCNGNPVASGFATIAGRVCPITNGVFSQLYNVCSNNSGNQASIIIEVVDNNGQQKNSFITSVGNTNLTINNIPACGISLSEFLTYKFDTTTYNNYDTLLVQQLSNTKTSFKGINITPYNLFSGTFNSSNTGTTVLDIQIIKKDSTYTTSTANPASISITEYGTIGQFVGGTYNGVVVNSLSGSTHIVIGSFRIKR